MHRPRMARRDDSLIGQVVAANVVLVALTLFAASLAAGLDLDVEEQRWQFAILAMAIAAGATAATSSPTALPCI